MHDELERIARLLDDVAAGRDPRAHVTTLPAKARRFCAGRTPLFEQEILRLRTPQRATLAPEGSIQAHFAVQASQGPAP